MASLIALRACSEFWAAGTWSAMHSRCGCWDPDGRAGQLGAVAARHPSAPGCLRQPDRVLALQEVDVNRPGGPLLWGCLARHEQPDGVAPLAVQGPRNASLGSADEASGPA